MIAGLYCAPPPALTHASETQFDWFFFFTAFAAFVIFSMCFYGEKHFYLT